MDNLTLARPQTPFFQKLTNAILAALVFSATAFFFTPLSTFLLNSLDFSLSFAEIFPYSLILFSVSTAIISVLLLLLRPLACMRAVSLVTGACAFIWLKANILLWDYGVWDGTPIDWGNYRFQGAVDVILLLAITVTAWAAHRVIYKSIRKAAAALILIQLASFFYSFNFTRAPELERDYVLARSFSKDFSSRKNVIIILIDSFRGELFGDLVNRYPEYRQALEGFTYYPEAVADSSLTWLSMLPIMTGQNYDSTYDLESFARKLYYSYSLPVVLKQEGFRVELHNCPSEKIYCGRGLAYNLIKRSKPSLLKISDELRMLYMASFFRSSPQFIKKYIHDRYLFPEAPLQARPPKPSAAIQPGNQTPKILKAGKPGLTPFGLDQHIKFLRWMKNNAAVSLKEPVFKFIYLRGIHPPFFYDAGFNYRGRSEEGDCRGYKEQAEAWLGLTCKFLDRLKEIGAYDNSLILLISDHGAELSPDCIGGHGPGPLQRANCLITVKPFNSREALRVSRAPVCLADIPKTVMSQLGLPDRFPGISLAGAEDGLERKLFHIRAGKRFADQFGRRYFPQLEIFEVSGPASRRDSWRLIYEEKKSPHKRRSLHLIPAGLD